MTARILDQVETVLSKEPSEESLYQLLKLVSPALDRAAVKRDHLNLYKKVQFQINSNTDASKAIRAQIVCESLEPFYMKCVKTLGGSRERTSSAASARSTRSVRSSASTASRRRMIESRNSTDSLRSAASIRSADTSIRSAATHGTSDSFGIKSAPSTDSLFNPANKRTSAKRQPPKSSAPKLGGINFRNPVPKNTEAEFDVTTKWPFMNIQQHPSIPPAEQIGSRVAFQCINARGAITHGRAPEKAYSAKNGMTNSVRDEFGKWGGYETLTTVDAIKRELVERGPVVSTSFILSSAFLDFGTGRRSSFNSDLENKKHPVLIVGWENTMVGQVWNVLPIVTTLSGTKVQEKYHKVAFGQYNIDKKCLVPSSNFEKWSWQNGPYFEYKFDMDYSLWGTWDKIDVTITSKQLGVLSRSLGGDLISAAISKKKVTLQDKEKKAHSVSCTLGKMVHIEDGDKWKVSLDFVKPSIKEVVVKTKSSKMKEVDC